MHIFFRSVGETSVKNNFSVVSQKKNVQIMLKWSDFDFLRSRVETRICVWLRKKIFFGWFDLFALVLNLFNGFLLKKIIDVQIM